jgi:hypothetical protein
VYETRQQKPLVRAAFVRRLLNHGALVFGLLLVSIAIGMAGYMRFEHLSALDAFLNSSMLLGGMGPVDMPRTNAGKLFAGFFALYAGLVFIATAALLLGPVVHRLLHRFHWDRN